MQEGRGIPYRQVMAETLADVADQLGIAVPAGEHDAFDGVVAHLARVPRGPARADRDPHSRLEARDPLQHRPRPAGGVDRHDRRRDRQARRRVRHRLLQARRPLIGRPSSGAPEPSARATCASPRRCSTTSSRARSSVCRRCGSIGSVRRARCSGRRRSPTCPPCRTPSIGSCPPERSRGDAARPRLRGMDAVARAVASGDDLYALLGVEPDASADDIRHAYRTLARRHHPDMIPGVDRPDGFRRVAAAYEILGDEQERAAYDRIVRFERLAAEQRARPGPIASRAAPRPTGRGELEGQSGFTESGGPRPPTGAARTGPALRRSTSGASSRSSGASWLRSSRSS